LIDEDVIGGDVVLGLIAVGVLENVSALVDDAMVKVSEVECGRNVLP
jgi:hypothetical protein